MSNKITKEINLTKGARLLIYQTEFGKLWKITQFFDICRTNLTFHCSQKVLGGHLGRSFRFVLDGYESGRRTTDHWGRSGGLGHVRNGGSEIQCAFPRTSRFGRWEWLCGNERIRLHHVSYMPIFEKVERFKQGFPNFFFNCPL